MDFIQFARAHGVEIDRLIDDGRWHRCKTIDKPRHRNGAYCFRGDVGWVQDWATMLEPDVWRPDNPATVKVDRAAVQERASEARRKILEAQRKAAARAKEIIQSCGYGLHPYLAAKGFPEVEGYIWRDGDDDKLIIPMRVGEMLVGLQAISGKDGHEKRFLYGQRIDGATFTIGRPGPRTTTFYCEGYATGLSVRDALQALKVPYVLHVCYSAGNMVKVAKERGPGIVIADYDKPSKQVPEQGGMGWKVARDIGGKFWTSDVEGEDANDFNRRRGLFALAQGIKLVMLRK